MLELYISPSRLMSPWREKTERTRRENTTNINTNKGDSVTDTIGIKIITKQGNEQYFANKYENI